MVVYLKLNQENSFNNDYKWRFTLCSHGSLSSLCSFWLLDTHCLLPHLHKIRHSHTHTHKRIHTLSVFNAKSAGLAINNPKSLTFSTVDATPLSQNCPSHTCIRVRIDRKYTDRSILYIRAYSVNEIDEIELGRRTCVIRIRMDLSSFLVIALRLARKPRGV